MRAGAALENESWAVRSQARLSSLRSGRAGAASFCGGEFLELPFRGTLKRFL